MRILIVGAGLSGAVFAERAKAEGHSVTVIDRRYHIAGNAHCVEKEGILVHCYGAHIFHTSNEEVWEYVNRFAEFNHYVNAPIAIYKDEVYNLPFNMNTFSRMWKIKTPKEAREKIEEQIRKAGITEPKNLEEQAISLVGTDVYEKLIRGYTKKQWGRECRDLPAFIIKRLPLRFTYDNNYFRDPHQGIPVDGYTKMAGRMLEGVEVHLGTDFRTYYDALPSKPDLVIYTGSIDEYFGYRFGRLAYRTLRFEEEFLETDNFQGNAVVNYTEEEVPYTRIIEHKHFNFGSQPVTVITREYPEEWKEGMEPYYPVNDKENETLYEKYRDLADTEEGVHFAGRLGTYRYYDMDKVIARALEDSAVLFG